MPTKLLSYIEAGLGPDCQVDYKIPFDAAIEALNTAKEVNKTTSTCMHLKHELAQKVLSSVTIVNGDLNIAQSSIPQAGSGVFATANIEQNKLVYFSDNPLVRCTTLEETNLVCCDWCCEMDNMNMINAIGMISRMPCADNPDMRKCKSCGGVSYCSRVCLEKAWEASHCAHCDPELISRVEVLKPEMKLTSRLLFGIQSGHISKLKFSQFNLLPNERWTGKDPILLTDPQLGDMMKKAELLKRISSSSLHLKEIAELLGRVATNLKWLDTSCGGRICAALDILTSLVNHSCTPNIWLIWNNGRIEARALKPIKAGEELFVSYVNPLNWVLKRQIALFKEHHFVCNCPKCINDSSADDAAGLDEMQKQKRWATIDTLERTWIKLRATLTKRDLPQPDFERYLKQIEDTAGRKFPRSMEPLPYIYLEFSKLFIGASQEQLALKAAVKAFIAHKGMRNLRYVETLKMLAYHLLIHRKLSLRSACVCSALKCDTDRFRVDLTEPAKDGTNFGEDRSSISIVAYGYTMFLGQEAETILGKENDSYVALKFPSFQCMQGADFPPTDARFAKRFVEAQTKMLKWAEVPLDKGIELDFLMDKMMKEFELTDASRLIRSAMGKTMDLIKLA